MCDVAKSPSPWDSPEVALGGASSGRCSGAGRLLLAYFEVGRSMSLSSREYRTASPRFPSNSVYDLRRAS
jgi:hypothetical protein